MEVTPRCQPSTFTDTKSIAVVKVSPADIPETEFTITPSASSSPNPDALMPSDLRPRAAEQRFDDRYLLDVSSHVHLVASPGLAIGIQSWSTDTGQFVDQFSSSYLQDIFFDWNVSPRCSPLDFAPKFPPVYASMETTPLGIISDPAHILAPSVYSEPASASELKRYCTFLICPIYLSSSLCCSVCIKINDRQNATFHAIFP